MREILFRGKLSNGDWLYGVPCKERSGKVMMYTPDEHGYVEPETVGQYTGRADENGVKIFEGDILKTKYCRICKVTYKPLAGFVGYDFDALNSKGMAPPTYMWWDVEVIGNIHDSPGLLEAAQ